jgi:hypothetical protein
MLEVITEGKNELMKQIQYIDGEMNVLGRGADAERWRKRYQLECELEELMENKEMYWQQPGGGGREMDPGRGGQYKIFFI